MFDLVPARCFGRSVPPFLEFWLSVLSDLLCRFRFRLVRCLIHLGGDDVAAGSRTVSDFIVRQNFYYLPGIEFPVGKITQWNKGTTREQTSCACLFHGARCSNRIWSRAQADRYGIDPFDDLKAWLLLPHVDPAMNGSRHSLQPKPLPALTTAALNQRPPVPASSCSTAACSTGA